MANLQTDIAILYAGSVIGPTFGKPFSAGDATPTVCGWLNVNQNGELLLAKSTGLYQYSPNGVPTLNASYTGLIASPDKHCANAGVPGDTADCPVAMLASTPTTIKVYNTWGAALVSTTPFTEAYGADAKDTAWADAISDLEGGAFPWCDLFYYWPRLVGDYTP